MGEHRTVRDLLGESCLVEEVVQFRMKRVTAELLGSEVWVLSPLGEVRSGNV